MGEGIWMFDRKCVPFTLALAFGLLTMGAGVESPQKRHAKSTDNNAIADKFLGKCKTRIKTCPKGWERDCGSFPYSNTSLFQCSPCKPGNFKDDSDYCSRHNSCNISCGEFIKVPGTNVADSTCGCKPSYYDPVQRNEHPLDNFYLCKCCYSRKCDNTQHYFSKLYPECPKTNLTLSQLSCAHDNSSCYPSLPDCTNMVRLNFTDTTPTASSGTARSPTSPSVTGKVATISATTPSGRDPTGHGIQWVILGVIVLLLFSLFCWYWCRGNKDHSIKIYQKSNVTIVESCQSKKNDSVRWRFAYVTAKPKIADPPLVTRGRGKYQNGDFRNFSDGDCIPVQLQSREESPLLAFVADPDRPLLASCESSSDDGDENVNGANSDHLVARGDEAVAVNCGCQDLEEWQQFMKQNQLHFLCFSDGTRFRLENEDFTTVSSDDYFKSAQKCYYLSSNLYPFRSGIDALISDLPYYILVQLAAVLDVPRTASADYRSLAEQFSCFKRARIDHLQVQYLKRHGSPTLQLILELAREKKTVQDLINALKATDMNELIDIVENHAKRVKDHWEKVEFEWNEVKRQFSDGSSGETDLVLELPFRKLQKVAELMDDPDPDHLMNAFPRESSFFSFSEWMRSLGVVSDQAEEIQKQRDVYLQYFEFYFELEKREEFENVIRENLSYSPTFQVIQKVLSVKRLTISDLMKSLHDIGREDCTEVLTENMAVPQSKLRGRSNAVAMRILTAH
eukprot:m.48611 g.48611  ORF g.48611 m.48611 type:complete len:735 (+) comp33900_c0_seq6:263-2467(+)